MADSSRHFFFSLLLLVSQLVSFLFEFSALLLSVYIYHPCIDKNATTASSKAAFLKSAADIRPILNQTMAEVCYLVHLEARHPCPSLYVDESPRDAFRSAEEQWPLVARHF